MSIAFQAVVLLVLALPGIIFFRNASREPHLRLAIAEEFARSSLVAAAFHAIWLPLWCVVGSLCGYRIDFNVAAMLAMGEYGHEDKFFPAAVEGLTSHPWAVFLYVLSLCLFAKALGQAWGHLYEWATRNRKVSASAWFLSHAAVDDPVAKRWNDWYDHLYSYEGEGYAFAIFAAVVEQGGIAYLYAGILLEAYPDDQGNPDRFLLAQPARRLLDPEEDETEFEEIEGDAFIIAASICRTINLLYVALDEDLPAATATVIDPQVPLGPGDEQWVDV